MSTDFPLISEHAVLADRLDRLLLAVDVVPPSLLQVPTLIRHKLHLHAVLKGEKSAMQKYVIHLPRPGFHFCGLA